jgi:hypothetical protein
MRRTGILLRAAALAAFASVLFAGLHAGAVRVRASLAVAPERLFSDELLKTAEQADRLLPPGAPAFYVCGDADTWSCGLWQRLLYPRPVFCLRAANPRHAEIFEDLRARFQVRYAIGEGPPPPDLRLARKTELPPSHWVADLVP